MSESIALGVLHTTLGLVAFAAGVRAVWRDGRMGLGKRLGQTYIWSTVGTCVIGFALFARDGSGLAYALAILTLLLIAVGVWPAGPLLFGRRWRQVRTVSFLVTLYLHGLRLGTEMVAGVLLLAFLCDTAWRFRPRASPRAWGMDRLPGQGLR
jgi:hypothetical protein